MVNKKTQISMPIIVLVDIILANLAILLGLIVSADFRISNIADFLPNYYLGIPLLTGILLIVFVIFRIYNVIWEFAGLSDIFRMTVAIALSCTIFSIIHTYIFESSISRVSYTIGALAMIGMFMCFRMFVRYISRKRILSENNESAMSGNIMIIGGGSAANVLIHDIKNSPSMKKCKTVCVIDDDPTKLNKYIYGVKIVGDRTTIVENAEKYDIDTIIFAIPSCSVNEKSEILQICSQTHCEIKTLPSINQILDGAVGISNVRSIEIEDLLGRTSIKIDLKKIMNYVEDKVILVTGGGGSIGSELCRQIASHNPKRLIIFDIYENNAYNIANELKRAYPEMNLSVLIGSVRDIDRLDAVFSKYKPDLVYHAAAHKHVPLMEDSPNESIKNNVFGTLNTAMTADKYGCEKFVLISTDKAVNPTNIMGASKRICEMIVQTFNKRSSTDFVAVRFGNVLGSNGSVIPVFKEQIANGGPVTVTHPDIIRYFMTIPEAVSLVLQAGASAQGGEIFVLDMGKPVKIIDLAENVIRLSGYKPYKDIDIQFTGLRQGEKLYEELLMEEEGLEATENELIHIGKPIDIDEEQLYKMLDKMRKEMKNDDANIRELVQEIVPTYKILDDKESE